MSKVTIEVGFNAFVMDSKDAVAVLDMLAKAEIYESKYHSDIGGTGKHGYTHHIYVQEPGTVNMKLISDEAYQLYKLAGKPEK